MQYFYKLQRLWTYVEKEICTTFPLFILLLLLLLLLLQRSHIRLSCLFRFRIDF